MPVKQALLAVAVTALLATIPLSAIEACDRQSNGNGNIMKSRIALPDDSKLNMAELGGVLAVAVDDCSNFVYDANFAKFLEEAQAGKRDAQDLIGLMYAHGAGTKQDWEKSLYWLRKAADQGSANASYRLGVIAQYGLAGEASLDAAREHYRKSSELGQGFATTNLGVMYMEGKGVVADATAAFAYFKRAAQQGDAAAFGNLGVMYLQGQGTEKNADEAVRMFRSGASMGNSTAMRMLAFSLGSSAQAKNDQAGVKQALMWAMLAEKAGDVPSKTIVDRARSQLNTDDFAEMQKRADRCESSEYKNCD
jgi:TPR repeat protein